MKNLITLLFLGLTSQEPSNKKTEVEHFVIKNVDVVIVSTQHKTGNLVEAKFTRWGRTFFVDNHLSDYYQKKYNFKRGDTVKVDIDFVSKTITNGTFVENKIYPQGQVDFSRYEIHK